MFDVAFLMSVYKSNINLLDRSINSIITQNYTHNINIFVILDGFNTLIESYLKNKIASIELIEKRHIKYFVKENTGLADSLNYGLSIISKENMVKHRNIVGSSPSFYQLDDFEAVTIDNPIDFEFAEFLYLKYRA